MARNKPNSLSNARLLLLHKQHMALSHVIIYVLRKPILSGPLESDIVTVRDMLEIATESKVSSIHLTVHLKVWG